MATAGDTSYLASGLIEQIEADAITSYSEGGVISKLTRSSLQEKADQITFQVVNRGTAQINTADIGAVTDGTEVSAVAINTDKKTITLAPYAVRADIYDDSRYSNVSDQANFTGTALGAAAAAYVDYSLARLFDDFNSSGDAGTSTVGMTVDNLYSAYGYILANAAKGQPYGVFHPNQIVGTYGLDNDLVTSNQFGGSPSLQGDALVNAWVDRIAGIDIFTSLEVETHGSTAAYGCVFIREAMGWGSKDFGGGMPFWVEGERQATYQRDAIMAHLFMGVIELDDKWGAMVDTKIA